MRKRRTTSFTTSQASNGHIFTTINTQHTIYTNSRGREGKKGKHSRAHCCCCTPLVAAAGAGDGVGVGFGALIVEIGAPLLSFCFFVVVVVVSTLLLIQIRMYAARRLSEGRDCRQAFQRGGGRIDSQASDLNTLPSGPCIRTGRASQCFRMSRGVTCNATRRSACRVASNASYGQKVNACGLCTGVELCGVYRCLLSITPMLSSLPRPLLVLQPALAFVRTSQMTRCTNQLRIRPDNHHRTMRWQSTLRRRDRLRPP